MEYVYYTKNLITGEEKKISYTDIKQIYCLLSDSLLKEMLHNGEIISDSMGNEFWAEEK